LIKYITQMITSTRPIAINRRPVIVLKGLITNGDKFNTLSRKNDKNIKAETKHTKIINPKGVIRFLRNALPVATENSEFIHFSLIDILYPFQNVV
jgi:hypothetical protein